MTDLCQDCGSSVAWGSGKYVNRIPADNGWLCVDCQCVECDKCHKDALEWGHPSHDDSQIWCIDCLSCPECDGWGTIEIDSPRPHGFNRDVGCLDVGKIECPECKGSGTLECEDE